MTLQNWVLHTTGSLVAGTQKNGRGVPGIHHLHKHSSPNFFWETHLHSYQRLWQLHCYEVLLFVFVAYCHHRLGTHSSAWCSCTLHSYIYQIFFYMYVTICLHISMNYMENIMDGTACASCANSGHQVLLCIWDWGYTTSWFRLNSCTKVHSW